MPAIRHSSGRQKPPDGFSDLEDDLLIFANKMRDAEAAPPTAGPRYQAVWPIFQITHQRSRYIYDLYYNKEAISRKLYEWLLAKGYADKGLIAKWKRDGYEKLCCLRCIQTKETNYNSTCICRVPRHQLKDGQHVECVSCGCHGCATGDLSSGVAASSKDRARAAPALIADGEEGEVNQQEIGQLAPQVEDVAVE